MANRMKREGLISVSHEARVLGRDRFLERAIWFPHGIVRDAVVMARQDRHEDRPTTVADKFRMLERLY